MAYVTGSKTSSGCVFCVSRQANNAEDERRHIVYRGEYAFIILNLFPYNPGHLLIVPYRHTADLLGLTADESGEMMGLAQRAIRALQTEDGPQGYNLGMNLGCIGGAGIANHLHLHLVPRWEGDTNFMPIIGGTKVLPELLSSTAKRLRKLLSESAGEPQPE